MEDVPTEKQAGNFDAVYVSIGAQRIHQEDFKHDNSGFNHRCIQLLPRIACEPLLLYQEKVLIYGGNKLASVHRPDHQTVQVPTHRYFYGDQKMMPAYDYETEDALAEGVDVQRLRSISRIENKKVVLEIMKVEKGKAVGTVNSRSWRPTCSSTPTNGNRFRFAASCSILRSTKTAP